MILTSVAERAANTRDVVGTVNQTEGLVRLDFNSVNLANTETAVYVDLVLTNGSTVRVYCSKAVSAGLRAKTIEPDMLYGFPIVSAETKEGIAIYRLEMPEGAANGHRISVDVSKLTVKEYVAPAISAADWFKLVG